MASTGRSLVILFCYLPIPFILTSLGSATAGITPPPRYTEVEAAVDLIHKRVRRSIDPTTGLRVQRLNYHINVTAGGKTHSLTLEHGGSIFGPNFKSQIVHTAKDGSTTWTDVTPSRDRLAAIEDNIYRDIHKNSVVHIEEDEEGQMWLNGIVSGARIRSRRQTSTGRQRLKRGTSGSGHVISVENLPGAKEVPYVTPKPPKPLPEITQEEARADSIPGNWTPPAGGRAPGAEELTLKPELAIVVEYKLSQQITAAGFTHEEYMAITVGSVNARYALTSNPNIVTRLNKVIVMPSEAEQPFIAEGKSDKVVPGGFDFHKIQSAYGKWAAKHMDLLGLHDMAPLQVGFVLDKDTLRGVSPEPGACQFSVNAVSGFQSWATPCSRDPGAYFEGSFTMAHEMAHNMGAPHDGDGAAANDPTCHWDLGFMMSYNGGGELNHYKLSPCSLRIIDAYARTEKGACLTKESGFDQSKLVTTNLQEGDKVDAKKVCDRYKKGWETTPQSSPDAYCRGVHCNEPGSDTADIIGHPLGNNAPCGQGGKCRNGWCLGQTFIRPVETPDEMCKRLGQNDKYGFIQANPTYDPCVPDTELICYFEEKVPEGISKSTIRPRITAPNGMKCNSEATKQVSFETKINKLDGFCFEGKCNTLAEFDKHPNRDKECILKSRKGDARRVKVPEKNGCKAPLLCAYGTESEVLVQGNDGTVCKDDDQVEGVCKNGACVLPGQVAPTLPTVQPGEPGSGSGSDPGSDHDQDSGKPSSSSAKTLQDVCRVFMKDPGATAKSAGPDRNSRCKTIQCIGTNTSDKRHVDKPELLEGVICGPLRRCKSGKCVTCSRSH